MKRVRLQALALLTLAVAVPAAAQSSLEDALAQYSATSVQGYIQPVADLFGANMNSGFFSGPAVSRSGLSFRFSILGMLAPITDEQKSYQASPPPGFDPSDAPAGSEPGKFLTSTIFGGPGTLVHDASNPSLSYRGSDGLLNPDNFFLANQFPLAVPQIAIGGVFGLELLGRYAVSPKLKSDATGGGGDDFPKVTMYAYGARYNIGKLLPVLPVDLAVGAYMSKFQIGDILDADGLTYGLQVSKSFPILTLYGGVSKEKTTMNLQYTSTDPSVPSGTVNIDLTGANTSRFTGGASVKLLFLRVFADVNVGSVTNYSGGLTFGN